MIDETLLTEGDRVALELDTTRSAPIQKAVEAVLRNQMIEKLEQQHAQGYSRHPTKQGEFDVSVEEQ